MNCDQTALLHYMRGDAKGLRITACFARGLGDADGSAAILDCFADRIERVVELQKAVFNKKLVHRGTP